QHTDGHGSHSREGPRRWADPDGDESGNASGSGCREDAYHHRCESDPGRASEKGQQHALGHVLLNQPAAPRAEGEPDRTLARTTPRTDETQVRDVAAGTEQRPDDAPEQEPARPPSVSSDGLRDRFPERRAVERIGAPLGPVPPFSETADQAF